MRNNIIADKSKAFAIRIIKLKQFLVKEFKEYSLADQILRSGTSIGANVREALRGQSTNDFRAKLNIALKEAEETQYWLELLYETSYIKEIEFKSLYKDCTELIKILTAILNKSYKN